MSDQAKWTTLMVLDAAALDAGTNMHCERLQLERLALAERIAAQLRSEGLLRDADAIVPPPAPISCLGLWVDPWPEQRADGRRDRRKCVTQEEFDALMDYRWLPRRLRWWLTSRRYRVAIL